MVVVDIALATICFLNQCHPVLVGVDTPKGEYQLAQRLTLSPGYGGDLLQFKETDQELYAIHRVWLLSPKEHRLQRLADPDPKHRVITHGCINLMPEVYEQLRDCCSNDKLVVK